MRFPAVFRTVPCPGGPKMGCLVYPVAGEFVAVQGWDLRGGVLKNSRPKSSGFAGHTFLVWTVSMAERSPSLHRLRPKVFIADEMGDRTQPRDLRRRERPLCQAWCKICRSS